MPLDDPIYDPYEKLRKGFVSFLRYVENLSPASPDYRERLRAKWESEGISEAFWRLEQIVIPDQVPR